MLEVATFMMYMSPPGKKTAMKFDVEKIFQETRRTAQEYSQQASGRRKFHPFFFLYVHVPQAELLLLQYTRIQ